MKMTKFYCTHCGKKFEAEERDSLECPGCFWSTSVVKDDGSVRESTEKPKPAPAQKGFSIAPVISFLKILLVVFVAIIFLWGVFQTTKPLFKKIGNRAKSIQLSFEEGKLKSSKTEKPKNAAEQASPDVALTQLTEEEKNVLLRKVQLSADRPVSPEEQTILDKRADFKTGIVEKIPSQSWTLETYKKLIADQERFYKITLPGSYKKKLEKLFKDKYVPAAEAFASGQLLQARDLWVGSLAFPIYADNPAKHRGVVLTMLRSFINDTLAKIGAINATLVEGKIREKEQVLMEGYGKLLDLVKNKMWPEASAAILEIDRKFEELSKPEQLSQPAPVYPQDIKFVDQGIQMSLMDIAQPNEPPLADFESIRQDIRAKRTVVESFIPSNFEAAQATYLAGMDFIEKKQWQEAEKRLREIIAPLTLAADASEKIKILRKLQSGAVLVSAAESQEKKKK